MKLLSETCEQILFFSWSREKTVFFCLFSSFLLSVQSDHECKMYLQELYSLEVLFYRRVIQYCIVKEM